MTDDRYHLDLTRYQTVLPICEGRALRSDGATENFRRWRHLLHEACFKFYPI